uniref:ribose-5-phosphate isomerase n=1 Tax=Rhipicephalus microplus TaxID=6941 RepID=A0A6M2CKK8_RHIMP
MDLVEKAKEAAAQRAVDNHIKHVTYTLQNNYIVGIGSGSTVVYAVEHLARRVKEHGWKISCVPTSFQAKELIRKHGLVMTDLEESPELNVAIDGADEIDAKLTLIKGGGGCLTQEKIIASCAKEFVVVADYRKDSSTLGVNLQSRMKFPLSVTTGPHFFAACRNSALCPSSFSIFLCTGT